MGQINYRVLHAPTTVGGNPQGISRALKNIGVDSDSLTLRQTVFDYPVDHVLWEENDSLLKMEFKRWKLLRNFAREYDIVHYNAGQTIAAPNLVGHLKKYGFLNYILRWCYRIYLTVLQNFEFQQIKKYGVKVFTTYQGDDARQGDYCIKKFKYSIARVVDDGYYDSITDNQKRRQIRKLRAISEKLYSLNPDLLYVLPKEAEFLPYSHIFFDEWLIKENSNTGPLKVLHAPSHRGVKGTALILTVLNKLKSEGFEFELLLVEGVSNKEARELYKKADLLVDQLYAGWYGGLAVELMALGKPVVAYLREQDLEFLPPQMKAEIPVINANPDSLEKVLRDMLLKSRKELAELGKLSRGYVMSWHNPHRVAQKLRRDYESALQLSETNVEVESI